MAPRFLLLQARDEGDEMLAQELRCFYRAAQIAEGEIRTHNLVEGPPSLENVSRHQALLIGGSGDYLVSRGDLPGFGKSLDLFRSLVESSFPIFASCFGFQCLVEALGGRIVFDSANAEVGTFEVSLTPAGEADPILGILPFAFQAQMGHKDRADVLPAGALHLAASDRSLFQAFRLPGKPIWATQFHPELTCNANRERFERYLENYRGHLQELEPGHDGVRFGESPETSRLLPEFIRRLG